MTEQSPAEAIFFAALEKGAAEERRAYLDAACGADSSLRQRVERLLAAHPQVGSFLEPAAQAAEAETTPPTGVQARTVIAGRYRLLQPIGEGGMGSVWMAQQTNPVSRLVAVKLIKEGMDSSAVLARFEAERQALAVMDHPNIAKVLDGGTTEGGRPFFVMELVKGTPITRYCDEHRLPVAQRLELFICVCQALQHAHQKGIVHRDLKPSNVLVAPYDGRPVPKVIDFGVAKATGPRLTERTLFTEFGAIIGTLQYMSPEQAELNNLDIDTRSDIYSLGVLLYELLTGTTPLDMNRLRGAAMAAVLMAIHEEEPLKPSTRLSQSTDSLPAIAAQRQSEPARLAKLLRGELDWIVMKALEKDRNRRYETANGLARDLERYLHDEVVEARPPTAGYRLRKFARKHGAALTAATTIVFLLVAGVAVSAWQAFRATRAEREIAEALTVAQAQRQEADDQRKKAETLAASFAVDIALKPCEVGEVALGLLRIAQTLRTAIPENDKELRECAALNILAWGQQFRPPIARLNHDGYRVDQALLSPDGLTLLTHGWDGTARLWNSLTGKQRAILNEAWPGERVNALPASDQLQFSSDGRKALTLHSRLAQKFRAGQRATDWKVCVWDVATGRLQAQTAAHPGQLYQICLSQNNSLLVTTVPIASRTMVFAWNAENGQLIRKLELKGQKSACSVSPDGRSVLVGDWDVYGHGEVQVWYPHEATPPKVLVLHGTKGDLGEAFNQAFIGSFSPSGRLAVTFSEDTVCWWDTSDWRLLQRLATSIAGKTKLLFVHEDIVVLSELPGDPGRLPSAQRFQPFEDSSSVFVKGQRQPIVSRVKECRASPNGALVALDADLVYESQSGQRRALPRGRRFDPELRQFAEDGRFALFPSYFLADLGTEKKIGSDFASRFLKNQNAWIGIDPRSGIFLLRKADASLDAALLEKWCQVATCGELDESGRYRKLDEATWDQRRQELSLQLQTNTDAQVLRAVTTNPLYWLRKEIEESTDPVPLLDRLVAADPTWVNYSWRAAAHRDKKHWAEAARDELAAARLAGDRYWLQASASITYVGTLWLDRDFKTPQLSWELGTELVQAPGRPREEYELALRWTEAQSQEGVGGESYRTTLIALALFRMQQYSKALAILQKRDLLALSVVAGMLSSQWNVMIPYQWIDLPGMTLGNLFTVDPIDVAVRAMCHHHLGQPQEAAACLHQARQLLGKEGGGVEQRALLNEAQTLIEGKVRP